MLIWQRTSIAGSYSAAVRLDGICLARLHARADAWQIESLDGIKAGSAGSVGHARRAALQALADILPRLEVRVQQALRTT
jgi:hypothetical protein